MFTARRTALAVVAAASLLTLSFAMPVGAEEEPAVIPDRLTRCMEDAGGVTSRMQECIGAEYKRVDAALNHYWQERVLTLDPPLLEATKKAQRQWLAYRDATCAAERATMAGGTLASVAQGHCMIRLTMQQQDWLKRMVESTTSR